MRRKERIGPGIEITLEDGGCDGDAVGGACDAGGAVVAAAASWARAFWSVGPNRLAKMRPTTSGRQTDRFIGTLSRRSRDND
jgi:hypothetical protein